MYIQAERDHNEICEEDCKSGDDEALECWVYFKT